MDGKLLGYVFSHYERLRIKLGILQICVINKISHLQLYCVRALVRARARGEDLLGPCATFSAK